MGIRSIGEQKLAVGKVEDLLALSTRNQVEIYNELVKQTELLKQQNLLLARLVKR